MPENINFLGNVKFSLSILRLKEVQYFCQAVNIPGVHYPPVAHHTPFHEDRIQGDRLQFDDLNITFKVDEYLNNYWSIFKWMKGVTFPDSYDQHRALRESREFSQTQFGALYSDITISILSSKQNPVCNVHFKDCFPVRLGELRFATTDEDIDFITAGATFSYSTFQYEQLPPVDGIGSAENVL
jgi:hypothetical protein